MTTRVVYVYPDQAFLVSLIMNGIILWGTARILRLSASWQRILAGAAAGGIYSFFAAFPHLGFLQEFWLKIFFSVLIVSAVFVPLPPRRFLHALAGFYITTFMAVGAIIGLQHLLNSNYGLSMSIKGFGQLLTRYGWYGLAAAVLLIFILAKWGGAMFHKKALQDVFRVPLKVLFEHDEVLIEALIDTGNQLQDPLTNIPVVVVEYGALKHLLPPEVQSAFEKQGGPDIMEVLESLAFTPWSARFRVIPFTSLGKSNGLLMGFRPDRLEILKRDHAVITDRVIIGIYTRELSPEGSYRALLHPDVLTKLSA